jgi:copper chaperone NosL
MKDTEIALYLVADFHQPGQLMDATTASYLISDQISSPMGANLSAFENEKVGLKAQEKFTGELYSWEEIQKHLKL